MSGLYVIKRDNRKEPCRFDKITARVTKLSYGLNPEFCDPVRFFFVGRRACISNAARVLLFVLPPPRPPGDPVTRTRGLPLLELAHPASQARAVGGAWCGGTGRVQAGTRGRGTARSARNSRVRCAGNFVFFAPGRAPPCSRPRPRRPRRR